MKKEQTDRAITETENLLRGTPPRNILISFDDKPPKTLEELAKEQRERKKVKKDRGDAR